jgi:hypothetical protein
MKNVQSVMLNVIDEDEASSLLIGRTNEKADTHR